MTTADEGYCVPYAVVKAADVGTALLLAASPNCRLTMLG